MFTQEIVRKIMGILKAGKTVELKIERGKLVIVAISRKAEKTDFILCQLNIWYAQSGADNSQLGLGGAIRSV